MRRFVFLVAIVIAVGAAQPARPRVLHAQAADPAVVPPGAVPLVLDEADHPGLPLHFRAMTDPFPEHGAAPLPSREGLERLRASGSAQFSAQ